MIPPKGAIADAERVSKLNNEKLQKLLEEAIYDFLNKADLLVETLKVKSEELGIDIETSISGLRLFNSFIEARFNVSDSDFRSDLTKLGFTPDQIDLIVSIIGSKQKILDERLRAERTAIIPSVAQIHWNIDVRFSSSEYLPEPEVFAIIRLVLEGQTEDVRFEMDKNQLIWLDTILEKIKEEYVIIEKKQGF
jgi:hypothetical protein